MDASAEDHYKNFAPWLELQPINVSVELLYRIAADLAANKGWPGVAFEVRRAADDLTTLTRHTPHLNS